MSLARPVTASKAQPVSPAYITRAGSGAFPAPTVKITALGGARPQASATGNLPTRVERPDRRMLDRALRDAAGITQRVRAALHHHFPPLVLDRSWARSLSVHHCFRRAQIERGKSVLLRCIFAVCVDPCCTAKVCANILGTFV